MAEWSSSCPTTGIYCGYLETIGKIEDHALVVDATSAGDEQRALLGQSLREAAVELRPGDEQRCRDGHCEVIDKLLFQVVGSMAVTRVNRKMFNQPLFRRRKNKT